MPIHPARLDEVVGVQDSWAQASTVSCGASENAVRICIHLSSMPEPELQKIEVFQKGEAQPRVAVRAPNMLRQGTQLSFTWSSAVRGLVGLILMQRCSEEQVWLTGERGSLAAALDSALSKQPGWICELFGIDVKGNSRARRLILRENPERKRPGPVSLSFHHRLLSSGDIAIIVDGKPCDDSNEVLSLRDSFFAAWEGQERASRRCLSSGRGGTASELEGTSTQASEKLGDLVGESASSANQSDFPARLEILADPWWMHTLRTLLQGEASTMLGHRSILWFPHYELNSVLHGRELVRMDSEQQDLPTLMLVHESLMRDTILVQSLNAAIRDAWLLLGRSAGELDQILRHIVSDSVYVELFSRYTGLYALEADVLKRARERGNKYEA